MSTAYSVPFGAIARAIGIENAPLPEPMSATMSLGLSFSLAITWSTLRSRSGLSIALMYSSAGRWASWKAEAAARPIPTSHRSAKNEIRTLRCLDIPTLLQMLIFDLRFARCYDPTPAALARQAKSPQPWLDPGVLKLQ